MRIFSWYHMGMPVLPEDGPFLRAFGDEVTLPDGKVARGVFQEYDVAMRDIRMSYDEFLLKCPISEIPPEKYYRRNEQETVVIIRGDRYRLTNYDQGSTGWVTYVLSKVTSSV